MSVVTRLLAFPHPSPTFHRIWWRKPGGRGRGRTARVLERRGTRSLRAVRHRRSESLPTPPSHARGIPLLLRIPRCSALRSLNLFISDQRISSFVKALTYIACLWRSSYIFLFCVHNPPSPHMPCTAHILQHCNAVCAQAASSQGALAAELRRLREDARTLAANPLPTPVAPGDPAGAATHPSAKSAARARATTPGRPTARPSLFLLVRRSRRREW